VVTGQQAEYLLDEADQVVWTTGANHAPDGEAVGGAGALAIPARVPGNGPHLSSRAQHCRTGGREGGAAALSLVDSMRGWIPPPASQTDRSRRGLLTHAGAAPCASRPPRCRRARRMSPSA
jgi:hypothetical protein